MRKKSLILVTIISLLVTACSSPENEKYEQKEISVYDIDLSENSDQALLDDYYVGNISPLFKENQPYIPYLSLEQYASLYTPRLMEGANSVVEDNDSSSFWAIFVGEDLYFYTGIYHQQKLVVTGGDISSAFKSDDDPTDRGALYYGGLFDEYTINFHLEGYEETYYFSSYSVKTIRANKQTYYPLGFLDLTFCESSEIYHYYNYQAIYETRDVENFAQKQFLNGENLETVNQQMKDVVGEQLMPQYLIEYNANMFFYTMDNFYGLRRHRRFTSFKQFIQSDSQYRFIYNDMFSANGNIRGNAYCTALRLLDDGHTALVSVPDAWGENEYKSYMNGMTTLARSSLRQTINTQRNYYKNSNLFNDENGIRYSKSGKTAIIFLDHFNYGTSEEVFNKDGSIKADAGQYDAYLQVLNSLKQIKAKGTVENVVVDVSLNGGGSVGVLAKILALISKDNKSEMHFNDEESGYISVIQTSVDSNNDQRYNAGDCFGNDFDFYIATSLVSYSAANAFAFTAQSYGLAKIIGGPSGGGECVVSIHYLPNGHYIYHSSNTHIGYYNEGEDLFYGNEGGVLVEYPFTNNSYYGHVDNIEALIS